MVSRELSLIVGGFGPHLLTVMMWASASFLVLVPAVLGSFLVKAVDGIGETLIIFHLEL